MGGWAVSAPNVRRLMIDKEVTNVLRQDHQYIWQRCVIDLEYLIQNIQTNYGMCMHVLRVRVAPCGLVENLTRLSAQRTALVVRKPLVRAGETALVATTQV